MRIGFDGSCLSNRRGFGRFANRLLSAFVPLAEGRGHEVVVVIDGPSASTVALPEGATARIVGVKDAPSASASARVVGGWETCWRWADRSPRLGST